MISTGSASAAATASTSTLHLIFAYMLVALLICSEWLLRRSTGQQTGSCRIAGTATASDWAVLMLYAQLHPMLRYKRTVQSFGMDRVCTKQLLLVRP
jgi:hypothetical protein